jgi:hypothetical protein
MHPLVRTAILAAIAGVIIFFAFFKASAATFESWAVDPYFFEPIVTAEGAFGHRMQPGPLVATSDQAECSTAKTAIVSQMRADEAATALAIGWPAEYSPISDARCIALRKEVMIVPVTSSTQPLICDVGLVWEEGMDYLAAVANCRP